MARNAVRPTRRFAALALIGTDIENVTEKLACTIEGAVPAYVSALRHMTATERMEVRAGCRKLSDHIAKRRGKARTATKIDELVDALSAEQVLSALHRATAPKNGHGNDHNI
jgi:hypothetical protein